MAETDPYEVYQMHPKKLKYCSSTNICTSSKPKVKDYVPSSDFYGTTLQHFNMESVTQSQAQPAFYTEAGKDYILIMTFCYWLIKL